MSQVVKQAPLRRQHRIDGVRRLKFDFHTVITFWFAGSTSKPRRAIGKNALRGATGTEGNRITVLP